jgi:ABC-type multidrug transport system ATPase subunit
VNPHTADSEHTEHQLTSSDFSLSVQSLSKRFNREWIFKNLSYTFQGGKIYAITGSNGSGKSTLLQILWGQLPATSGDLIYQEGSRKIPVEENYTQVAIATPYMELIDEFTLQEQIEFHFTLRKRRSTLSINEMIDSLYLNNARHKPISNFSSGMKQRLKLGLAFFTDAPFLFLDEPGTNLDAKGFAWYRKNLDEASGKQLIFIASNQPTEYPGNAISLKMEDFK